MAYSGSTRMNNSTLSYELEFANVSTPVLLKAN